MQRATFRNRPPMQGGCPLLADWGVGAEPEHSTPEASQRTQNGGEVGSAASHFSPILGEMSQSDKGGPPRFAKLNSPLALMC